MRDKWTIGKIACLAVAAVATVGATVIGAKQDIEAELPRLSLPDLESEDEGE